MWCEDEIMDYLFFQKNNRHRLFWYQLFVTHIYEFYDSGNRENDDRMG